MNPSKDLGVNSDLVYFVSEEWIRFKDLWLEEVSKESQPFSNWDIYDLRGYENLEAKWVAKTPDSAFRKSLSIEELQFSNEELSERYPDWMNEVSNIGSDCSEEKYMYLKEAEREDLRLLIRGIKPVPLTVDLKLYLTEEEVEGFKKDKDFSLEDCIRNGKVSFDKTIDVFSLTY